VRRVVLLFSGFVNARAPAFSIPARSKRLDLGYGAQVYRLRTRLERLELLLSKVWFTRSTASAQGALLGNTLPHHHPSPDLLAR